MTRTELLALEEFIEDYLDNEEQRTDGIDMLLYAIYTDKTNKTNGR